MHWKKLRELKNKISAIEEYKDYCTSLDAAIELLGHDFEDMKKLVNSSSWPAAVPSFLICDENSEQDKSERAKSIIDLYLNTEVLGKKFLDYGCGEGHVADLVGETASLSVGYDVVKPKLTSSKSLLTDNFEDVESHGKYDIVLIYDVFDHCPNDDILQKISGLIHEDSIVVMRCHPWSSRHGSHLYRQLNKAYLNLAFSNDELNELGINISEMPPPISNFLDFYRSKINESGLSVVSENLETETQENFFKDSLLVSKRIKNCLNSSNGSIWTEFTPLSINSDSKNTQFEIYGTSVFVKHDNSQSDIYYIEVNTGINVLTGIKIELLSDQRLPRGGPGLGSDGNFVLTYIEGETGGEKFYFNDTKASFSQNNYVISDSILNANANNNKGWAISPKIGISHWGIFKTRVEVKDKKFVIKLHHNFLRAGRPASKIGKFRISGTDVEDPFKNEELFDCMNIQFVDYSLKLK